jgi:hypothetical protein
MKLEEVDSLSSAIFPGLEKEDYNLYKQKDPRRFS